MVFLPTSREVMFEGKKEDRAVAFIIFECWPNF